MYRGVIESSGTHLVPVRVSLSALRYNLRQMSFCTDTSVHGDDKQRLRLHGRGVQLLYRTSRRAGVRAYKYWCLFT